MNLSSIENLQRWILFVDSILGYDWGLHELYPKKKFEKMYTSIQNHVQKMKTVHQEKTFCVFSLEVSHIDVDWIRIISPGNCIRIKENLNYLTTSFLKMRSVRDVVDTLKSDSACDRSRNQIVLGFSQITSKKKSFLGIDYDDCGKLYQSKWS